jgi:hypothetical protein
MANGFSLRTMQRSRNLHLEPQSKNLILIAVPEAS